MGRAGPNRCPSGNKASWFLCSPRGALRGNDGPRQGPDPASLRAAEAGAPALARHLPRLPHDRAGDLRLPAPQARALGQGRPGLELPELPVQPPRVALLLVLGPGPPLVHVHGRRRRPLLRGSRPRAGRLASAGRLARAVALAEPDPARRLLLVQRLEASRPYVGT